MSRCWLCTASLCSTAGHDVIVIAPMYQCCSTLIMPNAMHKCCMSQDANVCIHVHSLYDATLQEASIKSMERAASSSGDHKKLNQVASRRLKLDKHGMEKDEHGHRYILYIYQHNIT
jgi:hypothetical protein